MVSFEENNPNPSSSIHHVASALALIRDATGGLSHRRNLTEMVLAHAQQILETLRELEPRARAAAGLESFSEVALWFQDIVSRQSDESIISRLYTIDLHDDELLQISGHLREIAASYDLVSAEILDTWPQQDGIALASDKKTSEVSLSDLSKRSPQEILGALRLKRDEYRVALQAVKKQIDKYPEKTHTREFLDKAFLALMIAAGPTAVTSIEPWMTTPWEINFGERIGEGSLGPKYRGVLYGHMDKVVIEVLRDTSKRQQFLKTLQLWHMLDHSNVLPVLGGSVETARVFYVAPLMPAGTLRHYLARTRLGSEKRLQMLCEIALGVEYLHSHRVIHGCLNSSNVFVDDNGKPILTDFGFLDVRNSSDSDDVPEGAGSQAGDSWLFANIGYEMFSINPTSVHKHGAQKIIHPVARPADCPEKLWSLLQRCWEAELDQRPTFAMIVGELRDLMEISETATAALAAEIHAPTARKYSVNFGSPPPWLQVPSPSASLPSHPPPSRGASGLSILDDEEEIPESLSMEMERAIQGDPHAQNVIASYYERGVKGLTKNLTKAVRWYRKAADKGNAAAQCSLGRACEGGWGGLQKDLVQALKWFRKAAEQGNAFAEYRVGLSYEFGTRGLPKDLDMARNLFSKAADQGLADAQGRLGSWYEHGIGNLPNNLLLAAEWYRKSADGGGATGQYDLGRFYEHGLGGVPKDLKAALEWYDLSAQQGNHLAQSAIERLTQS